MREINVEKSDRPYLVSDDDYERVSNQKWEIGWRGATTYVRGKPILIHRFIMKPPRNMVVDHINGDRYDNRRENLRICTLAQNSCNRRKYVKTRSKYKGIFWEHRCKKWGARVYYQRKQYYFGYHPTEREAARAYNEGAKQLHGEYASLNNLSVE